MTSPGYAQRIRENISKSDIVSNNYELKKLIKNNAIESGKALAELPRIWFPPNQGSAALMKQVHGWDLVEAG